MMGHLDQAALQALLDETCVVAACSRWYEGFPNVVLEAMAASRAVLAADIGALPEIVDDGVTGVLYRAGDVDDAVEKLRSLWASPERCAALGAAGHAKARAVYGEALTYDAYMDVFRRVQSLVPEEAALAPDSESYAVPLG